MSGPINFRLRKDKDDDIQQKLDEIPSYIDKSDLIRDALRCYFKLQRRPTYKIKHKNLFQKLLGRR